MTQQQDTKNKYFAQILDRKIFQTLREDTGSYKIYEKKKIVVPIYDEYIRKKIGDKRYDSAGYGKYFKVNMKELEKVFDTNEINGASDLMVFKRSKLYEELESLVKDNLESMVDSINNIITTTKSTGLLLTPSQITPQDYEYYTIHRQHASEYNAVPYTYFTDVIKFYNSPYKSLLMATRDNIDINRSASYARDTENIKDQILSAERSGYNKHFKSNQDNNFIHLRGQTLFGYGADDGKKFLNIDETQADYGHSVVQNRAEYYKKLGYFYSKLEDINPNEAAKKIRKMFNINEIMAAKNVYNLYGSDTVAKAFEKTLSKQLKFTAEEKEIENNLRRLSNDFKSMARSSISDIADLELYKRTLYEASQLEDAADYPNKLAREVDAEVEIRRKLKNAFAFNPSSITIPTFFRFLFRYRTPEKKLRILFRTEKPIDNPLLTDVNSELQDVSPYENHYELKLPTQYLLKKAAVQTYSANQIMLAEAPYTQRQKWVEISLQQAVRRAVESNIDRVVWSPADRQRSRYQDLRKIKEFIVGYPTPAKEAYMSAGGRVFLSVGHSTDGPVEQYSSLSESNFKERYGNIVYDKIRNGDYKPLSKNPRGTDYNNDGYNYYKIPIEDVLSTSTFFEDIYGDGMGRPNDLAKAAKKLYKTDIKQYHVGNVSSTPIPVAKSTPHTATLLHLQERLGTIRDVATKLNFKRSYYIDKGVPLNISIDLQTGKYAANMSTEKRFSFNKLFHDSPEFEKMWNKHFVPYLQQQVNVQKKLFSKILTEHQSDAVDIVFMENRKINQKLTFNQILDTKLLKQKKLPGGSVRDVYELSDNLVAKVANSPKGLEQNDLAGDPYVETPRVVERGLDYIIVKNYPRNDKITRKFLKPLQKFTATDWFEKTPELQSVMEKLDLQDYLNYDLLWNDFKAYRNWGYDKENETPILIDEGALSKDITATSTPNSFSVDEWETVKKIRKHYKEKFNGDTVIKNKFKKLIESKEFSRPGNVGRRVFIELLNPGYDKKTLMRIGGGNQAETIGELMMQYSDALESFYQKNIDLYEKLETKADNQYEILRNEWIEKNPNYKGKKYYHQGFKIPEKAKESAHEILYSFKKKNPNKPKKVNEEHLPSSKIAKKYNALTNWVQQTFQTTLYGVRKISPEVARLLTRHDKDVLFKQDSRTRAVTPFIQYLNKLQRNDKNKYANIDIALKNGQFEYVKEIVEKDGVNLEFLKVAQVIETMGKEFVETDILHPNQLIDNYFPRHVANLEDLQLVLGKEKTGLIEDALATATKTKGRTLSEYEKADVINNVLAGYGSYVNGGIRWSKERVIEELQPEWNQYYLSSQDALLEFVVQGTAHIEQKRFFGKGTHVDDDGKQTKIYDGDSVGEYIQNLLEAGKIKPSDQHKLRALLDFRFAPSPFSSGVQAYKNIIYTFTLGNLDSGLSQLQDLGLSLYFEKSTLGLKAVPPILRAFARNLVRYVTFGKYTPKLGARDVDKGMLGVDKIWYEQDNMQSFTAKALNTVFKLNTMDFADGVGKDSHINTVLGKCRTQARQALKTGEIPIELQNWLGRAFDEKDWNKVIKQLDSGEITDDVKLLSFAVLQNIHPVSKSNMPIGYDKHPLLYQLRTFAINQLNFLAQEFKDTWNAANKETSLLKKAKLKAKATNNLGWAVASLTLAGASVQSIRDWVNGREPRFSDHTVGTLLRMLFISRYHFWKVKEQLELAAGKKKFGRREENVASIFIESVLPAGFTIPGVIAIDIARTINYAFEETEDELGDKILRPNLFQRLDSVYYLPMIGHQVYWWYGKGEIKARRSIYFRIKKDIEKIREDKNIENSRGVLEFIDAEDAVVYVEHMGYLLQQGEITENTFVRQLGKLFGTNNREYIEAKNILREKMKQREIKKIKKDLEEGIMPTIKTKKSKKSKKRKKVKF